MRQLGNNVLAGLLGTLFGTLRGRLILGVALLNAVLMSLFVWYLTDRQQGMLLERQTEHAIALSNSIATSSAGWLAARDYSGLQEIIDTQSRYPDILFAMILDPQKQVLAHTDTLMVGHYLLDLPDSEVFEANSRLISHTAELVDVVSPVVLAGTNIGWVRVGLGQKTTAERLREITHSGVLDAVAAILIGAILAAIMGWQVTRRLYAIQKVADSIQAGDREQRVRLKGRDEATKLGNAFDAMLNTLAQSEKELQEHRDHLSELVEEQTAELKRQQVFTQAVLENINDGIIACSKDGILSYFNRATREIHGIEQEELPAEQWTEHYRLFQEDGVTPMPTEQVPLYRAFNGEQLREQPLIIEHKNGNRHFMLCAGQPMLSESGEKIGAVISMHDVTEQKQFEAELIRARDEAEAANRAKSVFLANMSHELRTPLNAILGFSSLMRKDPQLPANLRQNCDIINRSGEHLLTLINDVLEMAKIESGRIQLESEPFDLGAMVRDVTEMMAIRAESNSINLTIDQSSLFPRYIVGDEARMRQILINLLGNAVKHTREGGVTLRLATKQNRNSHLIIEVEDTGVGISREDQQRIFEPFVQLGEQGTSKGTGLGLTITRQFVQKMNGGISLESVPGKGSLFRIELPLEQANESDISNSTQNDSGEVIGLAPDQPQYRILIVEDQRDNQLLLTHLLETVGLQVRLAENGAQAVEMFNSWQPHLIWMDRRMPVMDGMEATRRIRQLPDGDQVKIIAVTASAFAEQRSEMLKAGMDDYVRKPYREAEIYDTLSKQLGLKLLYAESEQDMEVTLTKEMLNALPEVLRHDLEEALESLDSDRIHAVITQVADYDQILHKTLSSLADNFNYPAILRAMQRDR